MSEGQREGRPARPRSFRRERRALEAKAREAADERSVFLQVLTSGVPRTPDERATWAALAARREVIECEISCVVLEEQLEDEEQIDEEERECSGRTFESVALHRVRYELAKARAQLAAAQSFLEGAEVRDGRGCRAADEGTAHA